MRFTPTPAPMPCNITKYDLSTVAGFASGAMPQTLATFNGFPQDGFPLAENPGIFPPLIGTPASWTVAFSGVYHLTAGFNIAVSGAGTFREYAILFKTLVPLSASWKASADSIHYAGVAVAVATVDWTGILHVGDQVALTVAHDAGGPLAGTASLLIDYRGGRVQPASVTPPTNGEPWTPNPLLPRAPTGGPLGP